MAVFLRTLNFSKFLSAGWKGTSTSLPFYSSIFKLPETLNYCDGAALKQDVVQDYSKVEKEMTQEVINKVNGQIEKKSHGRLFAVIQVAGHQFKITSEDIIVIKSFWPPTIGDEIRLEKVLLVGSSDFTLIGRPLLPLDQVSVYGTVIEKTLSHTLPVFRYWRRHNFMKCNFFKEELTYVRIKSINLTSKVNELGETDGLKDRIF